METKFKVGDMVRLRDLKDVPPIDRDTVVPDMGFKGLRKIVDVYQAKETNAYKIAGKGNYLYTEALLEKGDKEPPKEFKEVSLSQENITLSRDDFRDAVIEVMADLTCNPLKEDGSGRASFLMAMTVPIIAGKIEEKLFGSKEKEEE